MNTNRLKPFSQEARRILRDGVEVRLLYWEFDEKGKVGKGPEKIPGGCLFRGEVYNDDSILLKWGKLKQFIERHSFDDAEEEASYTWFNRLMAIKILEENGYNEPVISHDKKSGDPALLARAKQGSMPFLGKDGKEKVRQHILANRDEQAFGILLVGYCRAHHLLNQVFGGIDDFTELLLPNNLLSAGGIIPHINDTDAIEPDEYKQVELIGWLYQFYISEKKDEVFAGFKKNQKARPEDIPAATQIFTPKWIVKYMVENTVGRIWLDHKPDSALRAEMKYLVDSADKDNYKPTDIISSVADLTLLDPASGSGHILVVGFDLLMQMYKEEGYTTKNAVREILKNNLYGLDIDNRAAQLARFAVLLKAAEYDKEILSKVVLPNVYSFPEDNFDEHFLLLKLNLDDEKVKNFYGCEIGRAELEWEEDLVNENTGEVVSVVKTSSVVKPGEVLNEIIVQELKAKNVSSVFLNYSEELDFFINYKGRNFHNQLYKAIETLRQGKNIGSALKVELSPEVHEYVRQRFDEYELKASQTKLDLHEQAVWNRLKPFLEVLLVITRQYAAVVANPPYMGQKSMNDDLKEYVNNYYPKTKSDLMTVFMEVIPSFTKDQSRFALINLPSWLFLSSFEELRKFYIKNYYIESLLHMGRGIFGIDFGSVAYSIKKEKTVERRGNYFRLHQRNFQHIHYQDIEKLFLFSKGNRNYQYDFNLYRDDKGINEIPESGTKEGQKIFYPSMNQNDFIKIPGNPIAFWLSSREFELYDRGNIMKSYFKGLVGLQTGDNDQFLKFWFEINSRSVKTFIKYNKGGDFRKWYGNLELVVDWSENGKQIKEFTKNGKSASYPRNESKYFKEGITWSDVSSGGVSYRYLPPGTISDTCAPFIDTIDFNLLAYMNSAIVKRFAPILNPTIHFNVGNFHSLPFKEALINENTVKRCIDISKTDWDSRETSWDFKQSPLLNKSISLKQVYQNWLESSNAQFFQLHSNEEELNRIFIDLYGLRDELALEVPLTDITILQDELDFKKLEKIEKKFRKEGQEAIELPIKQDIVISQFLSYVVGCIMGRYRLDKPGLHIAHPNPSREETQPYQYNGNTVKIDEDAIVPIFGKKDSPFSDNIVAQVEEVIKIIWGEDQLTENLNFIESALGMSLEKFLNEKFWDFHAKMYKKKPIYWAFTSPEGNFEVWAYMHRMDKFTVQKIRLNYLHKYMEWLKHEITLLEKSGKNPKQKDEYEEALLDCQEYDKILKPLADKQITIDLDDGVTANQELFGEAVWQSK